MANLGSDWGQLSKHLLMTITPVEMTVPGDSRSFAPVIDANTVSFPIAPGGELRQQQNWSSPFENITPDASISTFSAMLQVGGFSRILQGLEKAPLMSGAAGAVSQLIGATSVTRFNSTQIYSGSPPLNMSITALFRALKNPQKEVSDPVSQLWEWMMPKKLSGDLALTSFAEGSEGSYSFAGMASGAVAALYPSRAPHIVQVTFGGMTLRPMVIESIGQSLDAPMDKDGQFVTAQIPLQINSLTGLDAGDWRAMRR